MTPRKRANFYLDEHLLVGLKALKERQGIPESEAVRRAVGEYLARHGGSKAQEMDRTGSAHAKRGSARSKRRTR